MTLKALWRTERECRIPDDWHGPDGRGGVFFFAATPEELRTVRPTYRAIAMGPDGKEAPSPWPKTTSDQRGAAVHAMSQLGAVDMETIDGHEIDLLPWIASKNRHALLSREVLEGPYDAVVNKVPSATVERLAAVKDWKGEGQEWAARLLADAKKPKTMSPIAKAFFTKTFGHPPPAGPLPPPDPEEYRADAWSAVLCKLVAISNYAESNHRSLYFESYPD